MVSTINGGALGRWFEELCRIKHIRIGAIVTAGGNRLLGGRLPVGGGVYAFWWTGDRELLRTSNCNRLMELCGPGGRIVTIKIDDDWLGLETRLPIPLYVGKNAANIGKRIGQHLRLGSKRMLGLKKNVKKAKAPTTSCQLRAGIDHLFPVNPDTRSLILENIGLSYVILDGDIHAVNRFYLEDLAIGLMKPAFNIDIER